MFKGEEVMPTLHLHRQSAFLMGRDRKVSPCKVSGEVRKQDFFWNVMFLSLEHNSSHRPPPSVTHSPLQLLPLPHLMLAQSMIRTYRCTYYCTEKCQRRLYTIQLSFIEQNGWRSVEKVMQFFRRCWLILYLFASKLFLNL